MADPEVLNILTEWGFEGHAEKFEENNIDIEAFKCLDEDSLKFLFPKLGDYLKFKKRFQEWSCDPLEMQADSKEASVQSVDPQYCTFTEADDAEGDISEEQGQAYVDAEESSPGETNLMRPFTRCKRKLNNSQRFGWTVEEVLLRNIRGRSVISYYRIHNADHPNTVPLNSAMRSRLVDILAHELLENNICGTNAVMNLLSNQIVELFPAESKEIYFVPPAGGRPKYVAARGKLLDAYRNWRCHYVELKVVNKRNEGQPQILKNMDDISRDSITEDNCEDEDPANSKEYIEWLHRNMQPWDDVQTKWRLSYKRRRKMDTIPISELFDYFPCLKCEAGYTLLLQDFDCMYPKETMHVNLGPNWTQIIPKILQMSRSLKNKPAVKNLLLLYDDPSLNTESKEYIHFLLLTHLCTLNYKLKIADGLWWKPNVSECQSAFILTVKTTDDIKPAIEKQRLLTTKRGLTTQPFVVIVSNTPVSVEGAYLVINSVVYHMGNITSAVVNCFKCMLVLNCEYPVEAKVIWLVLQNAVFGIKSKPSTRTGKVATLLCDFGFKPE